MLCIGQQTLQPDLAEETNLSHIYYTTYFTRTTYVRLWLYGCFGKINSTESRLKVHWNRVRNVDKTQVLFTQWKVTGFWTNMRWKMISFSISSLYVNWRNILSSLGTVLNRPSVYLQSSVYLHPSFASFNQEMRLSPKSYSML